MTRTMNRQTASTKGQSGTKIIRKARAKSSGNCTHCRHGLSELLSVLVSLSEFGELRIHQRRPAKKLPYQSVRMTIRGNRSIRHAS